ncbi:MAG: acyl-CoA desaturase [Actinobacteria bacterium]|nr:acyl-CoA desaturase [Actinomycetota bacterium]
MTLLDRPGIEQPVARGPKPATEGRKRRGEQLMLYVFVIVPFVAVLAAIPVAWGWGLGWSDLVIAFVFYNVSGLGITVGYHRYFTHGSFKANRGLKIAMAVAGSLAVEGPVIRWVADHRRHHAFSDREGDPHSPWRYGESVPALARGLFFAHIGWLFDVEHTNRQRFAPDLLADRDIVRVDRLFPVFTLVSVFAPALVGGLVTWSWTGALSAFFWASLVRIWLLHHVTWSINSICHTIGERPFAARDKSANFWPLALLSFGESWHNMHHADPTAARHGVLRGQLDISARVIWTFEKLRWATEVRWPKPERLARLRA